MSLSAMYLVNAMKILLLSDDADLIHAIDKFFLQGRTIFGLKNCGEPLENPRSFHGFSKGVVINATLVSYLRVNMTVQVRPMTFKNLFMTYRFA